jgi:hypothetical protein
VSERAVGCLSPSAPVNLSGVGAAPNREQTLASSSWLIVVLWQRDEWLLIIIIIIIIPFTRAIISFTRDINTE